MYSSPFQNHPRLSIPTPPQSNWKKNNSLKSQWAFIMKITMLSVGKIISWKAHLEWWQRPCQCSRGPVCRGGRGSGRANRSPPPSATCCTGQNWPTHTGSRVIKASRSPPPSATYCTGQNLPTHSQSRVNKARTSPQPKATYCTTGQNWPTVNFVHTHREGLINLC